MIRRLVGSRFAKAVYSCRLYWSSFVLPSLLLMTCCISSFSLVFSFHVFLLQMFPSSYPALILDYLILTNTMNFILCLYLSPLSLPSMGDETGLQVFIVSLLYFRPWFLYTIVEFGAFPCLLSCVCAVALFFVPFLWDAGSYSPFFLCIFLLNFISIFFYHRRISYSPFFYYSMWISHLCRLFHSSSYLRSSSSPPSSNSFYSS